MMFDITVLIMSLTLLLFPVYFESTIASGLLRILLVLPLWVTVLLRGSLAYHLKLVQANLLLFGFYTLILLSFTRSFVLGVATANELILNCFLIISLLMFAMSLVQNKHVTRDKLILGLMGSIGFYCLTNVVMHFLGFESSPKRLSEMFAAPMGNAVVLDFFGITVERTLFPLANGLNNFGAICGASLVFWTIILLKREYDSRRKGLSVILSAGSLIGVLMTDSRGPLLFGLSCIIFVLLFQKRIRIVPQMLLIMPLVIPFVFFSLEYIDNILYSYNINLLENLSRGTKDVQQLAGRAIVWQSAFDQLSSFSPLHLVGYGWYGQTISGIVYEYYQLALFFRNPERVTLHNSYLQYIFNIGYIGLLCFLILYRRVLREVVSDASLGSPVLTIATTAVLFYMALVSLFEVNLSMVGEESIFFVTIILVIFSKRPAFPQQPTTSE